MFPEDPPTHLRLNSAIWTPIIGWVVLAILLSEPLIKGNWPVIAAYGPGMILIAWGLFVFFWSPRVIVSKRAVTVRNVWHTTIIPYTRIEDVSIGLLVKLTYRNNHDQTCQVSSWNAPGIPKLPSQIRKHHAHSKHSGLLSSAASQQSSLTPALSPSQIIVETWFRHEKDPDSPSDRHINWASISITIGLIIWVVINYYS